MMHALENTPQGTQMLSQAIRENFPEEVAPGL